MSRTLLNNVVGHGGAAVESTAHYQLGNTARHKQTGTRKTCSTGSSYTLLQLLVGSRCGCCRSRCIVCVWQLQVQAVHSLLQLLQGPPGFCQLSSSGLLGGCGAGCLGLFTKWCV